MHGKMLNRFFPTLVFLILEGFSISWWHDDNGFEVCPGAGGVPPQSSLAAMQYSEGKWGGLTTSGKGAKEFLRTE